MGAASSSPTVSSAVANLNSQAQAVVGKATDRAADMCQQLPQLFGSPDKVPPAVLERCKQAAGVKSLTSAAGPGEICNSLEKVFGSLDKVPKEVQEKCSQVNAFGALTGAGGAAGGGLPSALGALTGSGPGAGGGLPSPLAALGALTGSGPGAGGAAAK
mmetsp:Transcript_181315/g.575437  ORF Transcript_181315/g.575437 Transcript_181315/m.575437 type:complete len:159 (-) Transcript_181315:21-497(-)